MREWYVNDERGIEQGWTIAAPPPSAGDGGLRIEVAVWGLRANVSEDGQSITFRGEARGWSLRYEGLRAWDARGEALAARLQDSQAGFAIAVDDEQACYPIVVDPVFCGADWSAGGNQYRARFGASVSGAGDVNGDGFDDLLVGAPWFDNGQEDEGRAFLYFGSASGPSGAPDWTAESDQRDAHFGESVCGAGDVNGDGFDDVLVAAPDFNDGVARGGRVYLYFGSTNGPAAAPDWSAYLNQVDPAFGSSICGAGDANGDGFQDVVVGARKFNDGESFEGRAYLYLGSAAGLSNFPWWRAEVDDTYATLGTSVSGAGDVDGDGRDDVIVGAPGSGHLELDYGKAFLYLGQAFADCNCNGLDDADEIASGASQDCNADGIPDDCEKDCDGNGIPDICERIGIGTPYCSTAPNSVGPCARIVALGSASASAGDLTLESSRVPNQPGVYFHGSNQISVPFGCGTLCTGANVARSIVVTGVAGNVARYAYDNSVPRRSLTGYVGQSRNFQYWYRDPTNFGACGNSFKLTNALTILIEP